MKLETHKGVKMNWTIFKRNHVISPCLSLGMSILLCLTGCAHRLEVKNMDMYQVSNISSMPLDTKIGVKAVSATREEERLLIATVNSLKTNGFFVVYPYFQQKGRETEVDYVMTLSPSSQYHGSNTNFWINWPGFLIWTPAWHGYHYRAVYDFDIFIRDVKNQKDFPKLTVPIDLEIRHAAMNRTWTEISWLEWGAIALIGGVIFTRYDDSVTPELLDHTEDKIGDYVASKVTSALASHQAGIKLDVLPPLEVPI